MSPLNFQSLALASSAVAASIFTLAAPTTSSAQSAPIKASIRTCAVQGSITLKLLGLTTTLPVACVNPTTRSAPGEDNKSLTGDIVMGVPQVANIATVSSPNGSSSFVANTGSVVLTGGTAASDISALQGMVAAHGLTENMVCTVTASNTSCNSEVSISSLTMGGSPVPLPTPIPANYALSSFGGMLKVKVLGLVVNVPVQVGVTLNETVETVNAQTAVKTVEHTVVRVRAFGGVNVPGIGEVGVSVDLKDYAESSNGGSGGS